LASISGWIRSVASLAMSPAILLQGCVANSFSPSPTFGLRPEYPDPICRPSLGRACCDPMRRRPLGRESKTGSRSDHNQLTAFQGNGESEKASTAPDSSRSLDETRAMPRRRLKSGLCHNVKKQFEHFPECVLNGR
jgi:hypothetical protein